MLLVCTMHLFLNNNARRIIRSMHIMMAQNPNGSFFNGTHLGVSLTWGIIFIVPLLYLERWEVLSIRVREYPITQSYCTGRVALFLSASIIIMWHKMDILHNSIYTLKFSNRKSYWEKMCKKCMVVKSA